MGPDNFIELDAKLGTLAAGAHSPIHTRIWHFLRGRTVFVGAPLLIAFIAVAASMGEPERVLSVVAAAGIAIHILALRFYRRKLRRALGKAALHAPVKNPALRSSIDDLRQWHLSHAYLLGALKIRATDDATRQLAAEAEDAAQGALAILNTMAASAESERLSETAAQRQVA